MFAWLIEINRGDGSPSFYWTGRGHEFSGAHECGIRFARKEDAERVIAGQLFKMRATAVEHGWVD